MEREIKRKREENGGKGRNGIRGNKGKIKDNKTLNDYVYFKSTSLFEISVVAVYIYFQILGIGSVSDWRHATPSTLNPLGQD